MKIFIYSLFIEKRRFDYSYLKIAFKESSFGAGITNMEKCRMNLGVKGFLPPPGGAHAQVITTSTISFQNSLFLS